MTGKVIGPVGPTFDLIRDLTGEQVPTERFVFAQAQVREELTRQLPWLAEIGTIPEAKYLREFLAAVEDTYGAHQAVRIVRDDSDIPGPELGLPEGVTLIRRRRG
ncbi:hypothetical protein [Longimicrobium sp.]|uniref:hypothetical protein n=1 Tax=Longimicrobium sp. TaxID=2029185 RepID=UPI002EDA32B5